MMQEPGHSNVKEEEEIGLAMATPGEEEPAVAPNFLVEAPCDLEAGYEFMVSLDCKTYQATVVRGFDLLKHSVVVVSTASIV